MNDLDLLVLWERGAERLAPECALALLATATPAADWEELVALPASERDARLLDLRARLFGDRLEARAACPMCAQDLDLSTRVSELRTAHNDGSAGEERVTVGDTVLLVRAPTAHDLVLAARCDSAESARRLLLERCVEPTDDATATEVTELQATVPAVLAALDRVSGAAALQLHVSCADCAAESDIEFDIVSFLWHEVTAEARRLAAEVVELARDLGWSQQEILSLSPMRRRLYLELVRS